LFELFEWFWIQKIYKRTIDFAGVVLAAGEVFDCDTCKITLYDKDRYEDHLNFHTGAKPFKCPLCDFATWGRVSLNGHTNKKHGLSRKMAQLEAFRKAGRDKEGDINSSLGAEETPDCASARE
jgi:uncharacterized C2H2 Zn-finger protein